jgi:hypothetical protein
MEGWELEGSHRLVLDTKFWIASSIRWLKVQLGKPYDVISKHPRLFWYEFVEHRADLKLG